MKIDLVFILILSLLVLYACVDSNKTSESMTNLDNDQKEQIKQLIYETYKIDVNSINNLSEIANKLQAGGLAVPGNLIMKGPILTDHNILHSDLNKTNGAIYRSEDKLTIATDNSINFRSSSKNSNNIEMNVNNGDINTNGKIIAKDRPTFGRNGHNRAGSLTIETNNNLGNKNDPGNNVRIAVAGDLDFWRQGEGWGSIMTMTQNNVDIKKPLIVPGLQIGNNGSIMTMTQNNVDIKKPLKVPSLQIGDYVLELSGENLLIRKGNAQIAKMYAGGFDICTTDNCNRHLYIRKNNVVGAETNDWKNGKVKFKMQDFIL
jgi:hypothetical protein